MADDVAGRMDLDAALAILEAELGRRQQAATPNPDGTYGQPPEGYFENPNTGQWTSREMLSNAIPMDRKQAFGEGGRSGLTFGFNDEMAGSEFNREMVRARQDKALEEYPWTYRAGQMVGALPAGLATAGVATGGTMAGTMARGAALGAAEGQTFMMGEAEGGAGERAREAVPGAVAGGVIGAVAPPLASAVKTGFNTLVGRPVMGVVDALMDRPSQRRAGNALRTTLKRSGSTVDDVGRELRLAASDGQPEFRAMDALGRAGARRASGLARAGDDAGEEIARFLEERQLDQGARVGGFMNDAFQTAGETATQRASRLSGERSARAAKEYGAARTAAQGQPVDLSGALGYIDQELGGYDGVQIAKDGIDGMLDKFRKRMVGTAEDGTATLSEFNRVFRLKRDIDDEIGYLTRKGKGEAASTLRDLRNEIDDALAAASEPYSAARDNYRQASQAIDAVDTGQGMAVPRNRAADVVDQFGRMTPEEQASARVGYADRRLAQLEANAAPTSNRAKPLTSPEATAKQDVMAGTTRLIGDGPAGGPMTAEAAQLRRRLARENTMWETQNRALQGSRTADNLADIGDTQAASTALGLARGNGVVDAIGNALNSISPMLRGENEATRRLIAEALMAGDTKPLERALRDHMTGQQVQRVVEMLLRRPATAGAVAVSQ